MSCWHKDGDIIINPELKDMIMDSCKHVFERPKSYNITEFCADGDPNYAVVNLKCSICGVVGSAIANIEWGGIMVDFEWSDEVDIEGYLPTFELQRKEL